MDSVGGVILPEYRTFNGKKSYNSQEFSTSAGAYNYMSDNASIIKNTVIKYDVEKIIKVVNSDLSVFIGYIPKSYEGHIWTTDSKKYEENEAF